MTVDEKIFNGIERAHKEGVPGWSSQAQATFFFGIDHKSLTEERIATIRSKGLYVYISTSPEEKKKNTDKKIADGIERAIKEDIKGWDSKNDLERFFGIARYALNEERVATIRSKGFYVKIGLKKKSVDSRILEGIRKAFEEGIKGWNSKYEVVKFFDIGYSALTEERIATIRSKGLYLKAGLTKEEVQKKILDGIKRAHKEGIEGWDYVNEAAKFFGISASALTKERIATIGSKGLYINVRLTKKDMDNKILEGIERAHEEGIEGWNSKYEVANFFDLHPLSVTEERIATIRSKELYVNVGMFGKERIQITEKKILEGIERALEEGIEGWDSRVKASEFFGVKDSTLTEKRIALIRSRGLYINVGLSLKERTQNFDKKVLKGIERALREGISGWDSRMEAGRFFGVESRGLTEERIATIQSYGLKIKKKLELSPNTLYALRRSEELGMRIDSIQALMELSLDFFAREIRVDSDTLDTLMSASNVIESIDESKAKSYVSAVAWGLIEDGVDDFSILELKLRLFREQVYLSEQRIESCLKELDVKTSEMHNNTLKKRFRLAKKASEYGLSKINYVDTLPRINNCENRNIFIHSSIRKKSSFMKLWKEYAEIMMREDIGGSISRSALPENLKIEEEMKKNSARAKGYLVDKDSIGHLKKLGYEGIAALILYGSRNAKNSLPRALHSLSARLTGFFLYLSQKGLAVPHSRFLVYTGGEVVSRIAEHFTQDHVVLKALPGFISSSGSKSIKKFHLLSYKFAIAVRHDADLKTLSFNEINAYVDSVEQEHVSGTLKLDSFCLKFLQHIGNTNAYKRKVDFDIDAQWTHYLLNSSVSTDALGWYKTLIEELREVTASRYENEKISEDSIKTHLRAIVFLLEFLSLFDHNLGRKEMTEALNPIIKSKTGRSFVTWAEKTNQSNAYQKYLSYYVTLFGNIQDATYLGLFPKAWIPRKDDSGERTLIRDGLELPVLVTYQDAVLTEPFPDERYPFLRSTPKGEMIDLSDWWHYDFSPVPVICAWLTSKLPRRGKHIRFLDVNRFIVFNPDGTLKGLSFNTDKNVDADPKKNLFIPKSLLIHAFSDEELRLLISYTKYIEQAYSDREPVKYTSKVYAGIMPLFPHHNKHDVLSEQVLRGYMTKVMIKTQIIVRHNAKNGVYDAYYSPSALETKREYLSTANLVTSKGKYDVPDSIEKLSSVTVNQCNSRYRLEQGVHNFRHAISTALAHLGLSIFRVQTFTGHKNIGTLGDVYMHSEDDVISLVRATTSKFFDDIRSPADTGNKFIEKICMPLVESKDSSVIFGALKEHGFMSLPRKINKGPEGVHIDNREDSVVSNGVEIASRFNPATWVAKSFGICPVGEGCPEESRGVCSLCPLLIFNASFVKGILLELNDAMNELAVFNAKNVESIRSASGDEVQKQVAQKISEVNAWNSMFAQAEAQLLGEDISSVGGDGKSITGVEAVSKNLFGFRQVSIDESNMELLYGAMELDLNDVRFDTKATRVAWKMAIQCAKNKDFTTLEQLEKEGLNKFIMKYGRMNFDEKRAFVLEMIGDAKSTASSPLVQQESTPMLLEVVE